MANPKRYDLEERCLTFAKNVRAFLGRVPKSLQNQEDSKQLIRSSGSVGANYIEANEAISRKDFALRIKISRKEAKESIFWLRLLDVSNHQTTELDSLIQEATELMKIFGSIVQKIS